jgi:hypothetical protein
MPVDRYALLEWIVEWEEDHPRQILDGMALIGLPPVSRTLERLGRPELPTRCPEDYYALKSCSTPSLEQAVRTAQHRSH